MAPDAEVPVQGPFGFKDSSERRIPDVQGVSSPQPAAPTAEILPNARASIAMLGLLTRVDTLEARISGLTADAVGVPPQFSQSVTTAVNLLKTKKLLVDTINPFLVNDQNEPGDSWRALFPILKEITG